MRLYPHKVNRLHSYLEEEVSHVVWRKEILSAQGTLLKKKKTHTMHCKGTGRTRIKRTMEK